jgi:hypothetical protein
LSGDAFLEEGTLNRLREAADAVSASRPYNYDLDFSGGRFSLILVEAVLPMHFLESDPESAISQDLQNFLDVLPPNERMQVRSTFRILWQEAGEVIGVAYSIEPPGRITAQKRVRPEEEYDRLAEKQTLEGYVPPSRRRMPKWAVYLIGLVLFGAGSLAIYHMSTDVRLNHLETAIIENLDLDGFADLFEIKEPEVSDGGLAFTLQPVEGCLERLGRLTASPQEDAPLPEELLARLAAEALVKGLIYLNIYDERGVLILRVPVDVPGFDGETPIRVQTRQILLSSYPESVRISP